MPKYTFEELMKMDLFERVEAVGDMTEEERKLVVTPIIDTDKVNRKLKESMARTPVGKYLTEI